VELPRTKSIIPDINEIQRIVKEYFEKSYSNKLENQEEMDKFLDTYDLPKLNQEDTNNLNISIISNEIEAVIKSVATKQSPGLDLITDEFHQTFKE
jgi:hypothetical protein